MSESEVKLVTYRGDEPEGQWENIIRFLHTLNEERYTFALGEEELSKSKMMKVAISENGGWIALSGWRHRWWGGVFYLVVHRDHQRQGLGKKLTLDLVKEVPKGMLLLLSVDRSNTRARKLYTDAGFVTLKRGKNHAFMAYRTPLFSLLELPLRLGFLLRSFLRPS